MFLAVTLSEFSPRMWGCSVSQQLACCHQSVFPTHVGMFRISCGPQTAGGSFPHACGDVPGFLIVIYLGFLFSPRMWGCPGHRRLPLRPRDVFPTHVGMFRRRRGRFRRHQSFPHACGDVP